jgi:Tol biopolymer transport system component
MGEVYRARDTRLGRDVAVKVLPETLSSDAGRLRRFEKEARSASSLNHPNIVTIHDIGTAEGVSYIAMELVDGMTLRELLADGALPTKRLLAIGAQVADGLAKAHAAGIVHRDLKPENVMVTKDGFVKILDFGLAKLTQAEDSGGATQAPTVSGGTEPGIVVGTVSYMSPEQTLGKALDFRSDQFSFGSMLYEMVAGKKAFARATGPETMAAIIREEPEPLASAATCTPVPLRWIVERCLAKDPEERYAATRDLARDLGRLKDGISEASASGAFAGAPAAAPHALPSKWLAATALALVGGVAIGVFATRRGPAPVADYRAVTYRRGTMDQARFAPDGQTIIYTARWEGNAPQLYSTRADSAETAALPLPSAFLSAISSSGKLAVGLLRDGAVTLAEMSLAGGAPREILEGTRFADWSPDGRGLAVINRGNLEFPIGKVLGRPGELAALFFPRFSPDGREIAAIERLRGDVEASSVVVFDVATGRKRTVSSGWGFAAGLAWHPRTGEIWFSPRDTLPGSVLMLCAVSPSSGKSRVIARPPGVTLVQDIAADGRVLLRVDDWHESTMYGRVGSPAETNLSWLDFSRVADLSEDGRTVILGEGGRGGGARGSVYLRRTEGSPATRLGDGTPLSLSPDGKWVIAEPGTIPDRLFVIPTGAGQSKEFRMEGMRYAPGAVWMHDSKHFLFQVRAGEKPWQNYVQDLSGGAPRPFGPEGFGVGGPVSPDGKVAILNAAGRRGWFLYPMGGGEPRPIPGLGPDVIDVLRWDATGGAVFVRKEKPPGVEIWRLDVETGRQEKVGDIWPSDPTGTDGIDTIMLTPDGKTYAYSFMRQLSTLFVVSGLR